MLRTLGNQQSLAASQKEMRSAFLGGFAGQFVAGLIWLKASLISVWINYVGAMAFLFVASLALFPLTQLFTRLMGRSAKVNPSNKLWALGSQVAFIVPLNFLLVVVVTLFNQYWFFPAAMIVVGSHYLPFVTLYGMPVFYILAAMLVLGGTAIALYAPSIFSLGGWLTGVTLIVFAFVCRKIVLAEEKVN